MQEDGVRLTRKLTPPEVPGVYYRILCMTGKNKGIAYYLESKRIVMGRGAGSDIQILDTNASRHHVELVKHKKTYILTDLKSQNGVLVNEFKIGQKELVDNDKFVIGKTVFRFNKMIVQKDLDHPAKEIQEEGQNVEKQPPSSLVKKNKRLMILVALGICLFLFLEEDTPSEQSPEKKVVRSISNDMDELVRKQNRGQSKDIQLKTLEYIRRGQREFREGNYFRAIEEFNLALISDTNNGDALFYLSKTRQALDNHIKEIADKGAKEYGQLKYMGALKSYCEIIRLLERYPHDERYKKAKSQVELVEQKAGYDKGEYKCWE